MIKTKFVFAVSFVAMMAVGTGHAEIAGVSYVEQQVGVATTAANNAQTSANNANTAAGKAQTSANNAQDAADAAQESADAAASAVASKLNKNLGSSAATKAVITDGSGNVTYGTISSGMITDGTVATADIAAGAVTAAKTTGIYGFIPSGSEGASTTAAIWVE